MREPRWARNEALLLALLLAACSEGDPAPVRESPASEARPADILPVTPPSVADACAEDLAERTPAEVRATIGDLGYDALFDDACLAQRAEQTGEPSLCEQLTVSTLRDRCILRVAIARARPTDCPTARTMEGRDPLCVALAARDRRLCAVAGLLDRAICERVFGRAGACSRLPDAERDECVSRAEDLARRVEGEVRSTPALETSLTITAPGGTTRTLTSADRGARLSYRGCTRVLSFGDEQRLLVPFGVAALALDVVVTGEAPFEARLARLPSDASSGLEISLDGLRSSRASEGTVTIDVLEPELGGQVEGTLHATLDGATPTIDGAFRTFVRDVDPLPASCGGGAAPLE